MWIACPKPLWEESADLFRSNMGTLSCSPLVKWACFVERVTYDVLSHMVAWPLTLFVAGDVPNAVCRFDVLDSWFCNCRRNIDWGRLSVLFSGRGHRSVSALERPIVGVAVRGVRNHSLQWNAESVATADGHLHSLGWLRGITVPCMYRLVRPRTASMRTVL